MEPWNHKAIQPVNLYFSAYAALPGDIYLFFVMVGGRVPSYLGSSFSFIAVVIAASGYSGHGPNLIVMGTGIGWVEHLMPPVVTGPVVAVIGLNLAPVAVKSMSGSQFDAWIGLITVLIIGLIAVSTTGLWRRLPNPRNLVTVAAALTAGAGDLTLKFGNFTMGGIGTATFGAIILYQVLAWDRSKE
jgi:xanthine/uracil permease